MILLPARSRILRLSGRWYDRSDGRIGERKAQERLRPGRDAGLTGPRGQRLVFHACEELAIFKGAINQHGNAEILGERQQPVFGSA